MGGSGKTGRGYKGCCEIHDNVFIGANAIRLPDVSIGPNALIAAGAVVARDVPPNSVVAGVPAGVIGTFDDFVQKRAAYGQEFKGLNSKEREQMEWELFYRKRNIGRDT